MRFFGRARNKKSAPETSTSQAPLQTEQSFQSPPAPPSYPNQQQTTPSIPVTATGSSSNVNNQVNIFPPKNLPPPPVFSPKFGTPLSVSPQPSSNIETPWITEEPIPQRVLGKNLPTPVYPNGSLTPLKTPKEIQKSSSSSLDSLDSPRVLGPKTAAKQPPGNLSKGKNDVSSNSSNSFDMPTQTKPASSNVVSLNKKAKQPLQQPTRKIIANSSSTDSSDDSLPTPKQPGKRPDPIKDNAPKTATPSSNMTASKPPTRRTSVYESSSESSDDNRVASQNIAKSKKPVISGPPKQTSSPKQLKQKGPTFDTSTESSDDSLPKRKKPGKRPDPIKDNTLKTATPSSKMTASKSPSRRTSVNGSSSDSSDDNRVASQNIAKGKKPVISGPPKQMSEKGPRFDTSTESSDDNLPQPKKPGKLSDPIKDNTRKTATPSSKMTTSKPPTRRTSVYESSSESDEDNRFTSNTIKKGKKPVGSDISQRISTFKVRDPDSHENDNRDEAPTSLSDKIARQKSTRNKKLESLAMIPKDSKQQKIHVDALKPAKLVTPRRLSAAPSLSDSSQDESITKTPLQPASPSPRTINRPKLSPVTQMKEINLNAKPVIPTEQQVSQLVKSPASFFETNSTPKTNKARASNEPAYINSNRRPRKSVISISEDLSIIDSPVIQPHIPDTTAESMTPFLATVKQGKYISSPKNENYILDIPEQSNSYGQITSDQYKQRVSVSPIDLSNKLAGPPDPSFKKISDNSTNNNNLATFIDPFKSAAPQLSIDSPKRYPLSTHGLKSDDQMLAELDARIRRNIEREMNAKIQSQTVNQLRENARFDMQASLNESTKKYVESQIQLALEPKLRMIESLERELLFLREQHRNERQVMSNQITAESQAIKERFEWEVAKIKEILQRETDSERVILRRQVDALESAYGAKLKEVVHDEQRQEKIAFAASSEVSDLKSSMDRLKFSIEHLLDVNGIARQCLERMQNREIALRNSLEIADKNEQRLKKHLKTCVPISVAQQFTSAAIQKGRSLQIFIGIGRKQLLFAPFLRELFNLLRRNTKYPQSKMSKSVPDTGTLSLMTFDNKSLGNLRKDQLRLLAENEKLHNELAQMQFELHAPRRKSLLSKQSEESIETANLKRLEITKTAKRNFVILLRKLWNRQIFYAFYRFRLNGICTTIKYRQDIIMQKANNERRHEIVIQHLIFVEKMVHLRQTFHFFNSVQTAIIEELYVLAQKPPGSKKEFLHPYTTNPVLGPILGKAIMGRSLTDSEQCPWNSPYYQHRYSQQQSKLYKPHFVAVDASRRDPLQNSLKNKTCPILPPEFLRHQFTVGLPLGSISKPLAPLVEQRKLNDLNHTTLVENYRGMPIQLLGTAGTGFVQTTEYNPTRSQRQPEQYQKTNFKQTWVAETDYNGRPLLSTHTSLNDVTGLNPKTNKSLDDQHSLNTQDIKPTEKGQTQPKKNIIQPWCLENELNIAKQEELLASEVLIRSKDILLFNHLEDTWNNNKSSSSSSVETNHLLQDNNLASAVIIPHIKEPIQSQYRTNKDVKINSSNINLIPKRLQPHGPPNIKKNQTQSFLQSTDLPALKDSIQQSPETHNLIKSPRIKTSRHSFYLLNKTNKSLNTENNKLSSNENTIIPYQQNKTSPNTQAPLIPMISHQTAETAVQSTLVMNPPPSTQEKLQPVDSILVLDESLKFVSLTKQIDSNIAPLQRSQTSEKMNGEKMVVSSLQQFSNAFQKKNSSDINTIGTSPILTAKPPSIPTAKTSPIPTTKTPLVLMAETPPIPLTETSFIPKKILKNINITPSNLTINVKDNDGTTSHDLYSENKKLPISKYTPVPQPILTNNPNIVSENVAHEQIQTGETAALISPRYNITALTSTVPMKGTTIIKADTPLYFDQPAHTNNTVVSKTPAGDNQLTSEQVKHSLISPKRVTRRVLYKDIGPLKSELLSAST